MRSVELGVPTFEISAVLSRRLGPVEVSTEAGIVYLRGTGLEHHVFTLREQPEPADRGPHGGARPRRSRGLAKKAEGFGTKIEGLGELPGIRRRFWIPV